MRLLSQNTGRWEHFGRENALLSQNMGRWEHFGGENAPSVPKYGTVGALWTELKTSVVEKS